MKFPAIGVSMTAMELGSEHGDVGRRGGMFLRCAGNLLLHLLIQILAVPLFFVLLVAWVGLGLPFSLVHVVLVGLVAGLTIKGVAVRVRRRRRHA